MLLDVDIERKFITLCATEGRALQHMFFPRLLPLWEKVGGKFYESEQNRSLSFIRQCFLLRLIEFQEVCGVENSGDTCGLIIGMLTLGRGFERTVKLTPSRGHE